MLASRHTQFQRRGIVLVLVLAMLGLLAVIGVSFATFSGQARIGARNYALSVTRPTATDMMDFALAQLVGDTNDVRSAIRGHSLARDMYGNDGYNNGYLALNPAINSNFLVTGVTYFPITPGDLRNGTIKCATNIPAGTNTPGASALYGYDFTRWTIRFSPRYIPYNVLYDGHPTATFLVGQSFEVLVDDASGNDTTYPNVRVFYIAAPPDLIKNANPLPPTVPVVENKPLMGLRKGYPSPEVPPVTVISPQVATTVQSQMIGESFAVTTTDPTTHDIVVSTPGVPVSTVNAHFPFILDGRYLRAFNGPGLEAAAKYANFRYNGQLLGGPNWVGDPNVIGLDEDYDACDLENWFLAIQSADGQVIVPSFHRPGVIRYDPTTKLTDWELTTTDARARILRPRAKDGHDRSTFPDLLPDPTSGKINYDVDNDGDGITDSVWVDLGYPPRRDSRGQLVKPLFAFMVIGLNGRIPLNTAGNLAMRNGAGNPVFMHTSHLGNSPSEVDPTFALQNGTSLNFSASGPYNTSSQFDNAGIQTAGFIGTDANGNPAFIPGDSTIATGPGGTGVSVNVTQLRNLLTGTRPSPSNDANWVITNGQQFFMPNNVPDIADIGSGGIINLPGHSVAGRWGEPGGITSFFNTNVTPLEAFINPVRAGKSIVGLGVPPGPPPVGGFPGPFYNRFATDGRDDNSNANDFWPQPNASESAGTSPITLNGGGPNVIHWFADYYDAAGDLAIPAERMRRFVTPVDVAGDGQLLNWTNRADIGADSFGRVAYRRYFRPAGVPAATDTFTDPLSDTAYKRGTATVPDLTNNRTHGYESQRNPGLGSPSQRLNVYAAAPGDLDSSGNQTTVAVGGFNLPGDVPGTTTIPTFNQYVNSYASIDPSTFLYSPSPNLNEASEMNLYLSGTSTVDQPFGMGDLEWLYRGQDSDADTLHSRLADLAPISFTNPIDSTRRRRLFTTETWETNSFVWAQDNPLGRYSDNSRFQWPTNAPYGNAVANGTFLLNADASLNSLYLQNMPLVNNTPLATTNRTGPPYTAPLSAGYGYGPPINTNTSSLAHRDRKINLNYPLPVSNDPNEPTRQKWIAEAYQLLKQVLPPLSLDTPEELAQLSQYLINVIDFRDPDGTMTHWQNPDVFLVPGKTGAAPTAPYLAFAGTTGLTGALPLDQYGMEYNPVALNEVLAFSYQNYPTGRNNRFFVELINTLTAAATGSASTLDLSGFNYTKDDPYSGGCWDLVFTADDPASRPDPFRGDLVQGGNFYGLIPLNRDTFGQTTAAYDVNLIPLNAASAALTPLNPKNKTPTPTATAIPAPPAVQTTPPTDYFYVLGNNPPNSTFEQGTPGPTNYWPGTTTTANTPTTPYIAANTPTMTQALASSYDPMNGTAPGTPPFTVYQGLLPGVVPTQGGIQGTLPPNYQWKLPAPAAQKVTYYWVCLRRPANPFAGVSPTNPMIVVDAVRFPYIEGTGPLVNITSPPKGGPTSAPDTSKANTVFSVQRFQPNRGGHAVPYYAPATQVTPPNPPTPVTPPPLDTHFGFSEQIVQPGTGVNYSPLFGTRGVYYIDKSGGSPVYYYSTGGLPATGKTGGSTTTAGLFHTLGWANEQTDNWDLFPFHDRDFTSVAELTLVPGCPSGLFTKQFAETAPSAAFVNGAPVTAATFIYPIVPKPSTTQASNYASAPFPAPSATVPTKSFPYLSDKFFYSSASPTFNGVPLTGVGSWDPVSGASSGGWFKMFELFEVPSPVFGAIGQVTQGTNYDWLRQDTKPGLLNLNLIIDEEVYLGLMGNAGNINPQPPTVQIPAGGPAYRLQQVSTPPPSLNNVQVGQDNTGVSAGPSFTPQVITLWSTAGGPAPLTFEMAGTTQVGAYPVPSVGFLDSTPAINSNQMKAGFSDFLKLRHGGTGYMFGPGPEAPFRSLTYPDINFTAFRPAFPPTNDGFSGTVTISAGVPTFGAKGGDAGVKATRTVTGGTATIYPPAVPPRRLFQIPDTDVGNANINGDNFSLGYTPKANASLNKNLVDLASGTIPSGNKEHPYYRSEWYQKVLNLSTVRTHQFAVWITVGFFEVTAQGDPTLATIVPQPNGAYDVIGKEVGLLNGTNTRYRGFFVVDRLQLGGFDPSSPGNFRNAVLYRRIIQ
jgi:hypothetical protein